MKAMKITKIPTIKGGAPPIGTGKVKINPFGKVNIGKVKI